MPRRSSGAIAIINPEPYRIEDDSRRIESVGKDATKAVLESADVAKSIRWTLGSNRRGCRRRPFARTIASTPTRI
jgi:hypothetical protein